jgi:hypothetical protein
MDYKVLKDSQLDKRLSKDMFTNRFCKNEIDSTQYSKINIFYLQTERLRIKQL